MYEAFRIGRLLRHYATVTRAMEQAKKPFGNTETLRHVKRKEKMKGKLPASGVISLQICGTGGYDCGRSVLLSTDHSKYLFNCGEGTQRFINEHKLKMAKLEHIFITHKRWENVGGLLGMALTLQAVNVPLVTIHGPPAVEKGVQMSKNFADVKTASVQKVELETDEFSDHTFRIEAVPLKAGKADVHLSKRARVDGEQDLAVAYICRPHPYPRKVDLARCVELGIKSGPLLGRLKAGETVALEDGTEIRPEQILRDELPVRPILIVDLPGTAYLNSLLESESVRQLSTAETVEGGGEGSNEDRLAEVVIHLSDQGIIGDEKYQDWIKSFPSSTKHLIFEPTDCDVNYRTPFRCQAMLNQLHGEIFPLLHSQCGDMNTYDPNFESSVIKVAPNLKYVYRPKKAFDDCGVVTLNNKEYLEESAAQPEFHDKLQQLELQLGTMDNAYDSCSYPHLVFLGTGSSVPSSSRNVSAILLHTSPDSCILLDSGEGTLGQLYRFYGTETTDVLKRLKGILISHLHADHHLGVFSFVLERHKFFSEESWYQPLDVVCPTNYKRWAQSFLSDFIPVESCIVHHDNRSFLEQNLCDDRAEIADRLSLRTLESVLVKHCKGSFGFVMELKDGKKITYSGDTMPCEDLIRVGANSDLLVHEATMEDDLAEDAKRKTHSTTSEAIAVGKQMNAKFTILTHFSQRYAKIPFVGDDINSGIGIAFDNMRVDFNQFRLLPLFVPVLKALFSEHYAELEANYEKRKIRARGLEMAANTAT